MFQKVSINQIFLFEVWGSQGFLAPAPAGFNGNDDPWIAKGNIGGKEFEINVTKEEMGKDKTGNEIPVPMKNGEKFQITFERGEEKDSVEGTIKYL